MKLFYQNRRYPEENCDYMYHQFVNMRTPENTCLAIVRFENIIGKNVRARIRTYGYSQIKI